MKNTKLLKTKQKTPKNLYGKIEQQEQEQEQH
jgi:hypothetical protein